MSIQAHHFGLIELLLVFGLVLAWALWQWWDWWRWRQRQRQRREQEQTARDEQQLPPNS